jgi:hypothetical protein
LFLEPLLESFAGMPMAKGNAFLGCVVFKERAQLGFDFVFLSVAPQK